MDEFMKRRNRMAAEKVIAALRRRHMNGEYAETKEEALRLALVAIPEGSTVGWGGSMSIEEIGLKAAVKAGPYRCIDRDAAKDAEERKMLERQCFSADVYLMSTNAITEDGILVNLDGRGPRVAALCYGPDQVLIIAGINKLAADVEAAIERVRHTAAPINALRFPGKTPCREGGLCRNCLGEGCLCSDLVITRNSMFPGRIHVILVGEDLGY